MSSTLLRAENELLVGVMPSLAGKKPPLLKDSLGVIAHEQSVQPYAQPRRFAATGVTDPIIGLVTLLISGVETLFFATKTNIYKYTHAGGVSSVGSSYTGTNLDLWSLVRWGNWVLAANGVDTSQIWKSTTFGAMGDIPAGVSIFVPWRALMVAFGPEGIYWSAYDDPEVYTSALSNFAGELPPRDILSRIKAAVPLGDAIIFYTEDEARALTYVGPTNIFGQSAIRDSVGAVGKAAVCSADKKHFGWSRNGRWMSDGNSFQMIDSPQVKDYIESDLNRDNIAGVVAWHQPEFEIVCFSYPRAASDCNCSTVAFNYRSGAWWPLGAGDFGRTIVQTNTVFGYPLAGDSVGRIWEMPVEHVLAGAGGSPGTAMSLSESGHLIYQATETAFGEALFGTAPHGEMRTF